MWKMAVLRRCCFPYSGYSTCCPINSSNSLSPSYVSMIAPCSRLLPRRDNFSNLCNPGAQRARGAMNRLQKHNRIRLDRESYLHLQRWVIERDGWRCQYCGSHTQLQVHHLAHRSQQGSDEESNLITLCSDCHRNVHSPLPLAKPRFGLVSILLLTYCSLFFYSSMCNSGALESVILTLWPTTSSSATASSLLPRTAFLQQS